MRDFAEFREFIEKPEQKQERKDVWQKVFNDSKEMYGNERATKIADKQDIIELLYQYHQWSSQC